MGSIEFRIDVDDNDISTLLKRAIQSGMEDATKKLLEDAQKVAVNKIRDEGAVWRHELEQGFVHYTSSRPDGEYAVLRNVADHASYQEHGVSGRYYQRNTPHAYTYRGPPIEALLPWVREHLVGTGFYQELRNRRPESRGTREPAPSGVPTFTSPSKYDALYEFEQGDILDSFYGPQKVREPYETSTRNGIEVGWNYNYWLLQPDDRGWFYSRIDGDEQVEFISQEEVPRWYDAGDDDIIGVEYVDIGGIEELKYLRSSDIPSAYTTEYDESYWSKASNWSEGMNLVIRFNDGTLHEVQVIEVEDGKLLVSDSVTEFTYWVNPADSADRSMDGAVIAVPEQ